jgi:hypothetical protein
MDASEIELLVKSGVEMPEDLNIAESYYFLSLDYIRRIKLPHDERERRYRLVRQSFDSYRREITVYQNTCEMRVRFAGIAKEMTINGCPLCKKAIAVFDGRNTEMKVLQCK